jgi:carboxymethylenebutenolidase
MNKVLTPEQQKLVDIWEKHTMCEFETKDVEETMHTMNNRPHVNHVPVMTGGFGRDNVQNFYSKYFIPNMPKDFELRLISRTVSTDTIVDEFIVEFTHSIDMPWMLPGIPPTGKKVEIPTVAIVGFKDGKITSEHIYWDQASVLVQIGVLNADNLPVAGVETARKVLDPSLPSNELMKR